MKIVVLDFETADTGADSACALGVVQIENGRICEEKAYLIRPPRQTFHFTHIHGLTWQHVCDAPTFKELLPTITGHFTGADFIAAHNAAFDRKVLLTCMGKAGHTPPSLGALCTVQLARQAWGIYPTTLPAVCSHFNIALQHHDALSDARACARIITKAIEEDFPIERARLNPPSYRVPVATR
ncbi:DNA polymerase III subunit epsilon [Iodidimonas muriae]|uniref:DNA polymerase III subunit epsilon n=1 Tax=Iodidimonas muriae TaxID=261467 RepID=A0ABQ2LD74_9PROT|nr:exonuclease domain-containing protein [Iodidimonas muriae]GER07931.1 DNA polymerase III subunit epsilon [Kordiimonadales bacterium JCM 17843]GGO11845.1 DNA polymerase III subunit epsilon [Iodidimonas muriae]